MRNAIKDLDSAEIEYDHCRNIFRTKEANGWLREAKDVAVPKTLFGELWIEGELSIFFADTGKGKSVLAVQIAESIARGVPIEPLKLSAEPQKVIYFDFELSQKQFEARYSAIVSENSSIDHYQFSRNLLRSELDTFERLPAGFDDFYEYLHASLEELIDFSDAKIIIVDNITYLNTSTQNSSAALRLMKGLKFLKLEHGLSVLVLAHTPKRNSASSLTVNDLQGSKMLANFADSIFAMGASHKQKDLRYLKQIKLRNSQMKYDASNVCLFRLEKPGNFLGFKFAGFDTEREHLKWNYSRTDEERATLAERVKTFSAAGNTQRTIASELGISIATVNRYLKG